MAITEEQLEALAGSLAEYGNIFSDMQQLLTVLQTGTADQREIVSRRLESTLPIVRALFEKVGDPPSPQPSAARLKAIARALGKVQGNTGSGGLAGIVALLLAHKRGTLGVTLTAAQITEAENSITALVSEVKTEAAKL